MAPRPPLCPQEAARQVALLMHERLGLRAAPLGQMVRNAGRQLPRAARTEASWLADAASETAHPRRSHCYDPARVEKARDVCLRALERIDPKTEAARRRAGLFGGIAFNLLVVLGGFLAFVALRT